MVSTLDFNILRATYGLSLGSKGYDARADVNFDNMVSANNFNIYRASFGQTGDPLYNPGRPSK